MFFVSIINETWFLWILIYTQMFVRLCMTSHSLLVLRIDVCRPHVKTKIGWVLHRRKKIKHTAALLTFYSSWNFIIHCLIWSYDVLLSDEGRRRKRKRNVSWKYFLFCHLEEKEKKLIFVLCLFFCFYTSCAFLSQEKNKTKLYRSEPSHRKKEEIICNAKEKTSE